MKNRLLAAIMALGYQAEESGDVVIATKPREKKPNRKRFEKQDHPVPKPIPKFKHRQQKRRRK